jgi:hypothetical protein
MLFLFARVSPSESLPQFLTWDNGCSCMVDTDADIDLVVKHGAMKELVLVFRFAEKM